MTPNIFTLRRRASRTALAVICAIAIEPGDALAGFWASSQANGLARVPVTPPSPSVQAGAPAFSADHLDSLVAPIALYPDPLLAQTLAAATYPNEIVELNEWLMKNPGLQGEALANAVEKQPW